MSNDDQKNIDLILLTIGVLVGVAVGLFVIARDMGNATMARMQLNDPAYQAAVNQRIAPVGRVVIDGEAVASDTLAVVIQTDAVPTVMTGPQVYNAACISCHGGGLGGAPTTGDSAEWSGRIAQGMDTLNRHAIEGFLGSAGYMPPKGGRLDLSDEEIIASVQYLVEQSR